MPLPPWGNNGESLHLDVSSKYMQTIYSVREDIAKP